MNLGECLLSVLSDEMLLENFTAIWSHVNENEKQKWQKIQNLKFTILSKNEWGPSAGVCIYFGP